MTRTAEQLVQLGMRAVIRDVQDYLDGHALTFPSHGDRTVTDVGVLKAYLLALLITAGAYEDLDDAA